MRMFAETELCVQDIGEVCGFSRKTFYRLKENGVSLEWAEKIAHNLGLHPTEIWGAAYLMASASEDDPITHRPHATATIRH
jgi:hypothetical protein